MAFQEFIASFKKIGIHFSLMIGLFVIILFIVSISLNIYTDHGEKDPVPDFSNLNIEKAKEIAATQNLKLQIIDSVHITDAIPGNIVDQTPKPGFYVKENRSIFLTINAFMPEMVSMPDLLNISLRQAKSIIEINGLKLGKLKYAPDFAKNYVLAQMVENKNIEKGVSIPKGTTIDLLLGLGNSNKDTFIPDLEGVTFKTALDKITKSSLNIGAKIFSGNFETFEDSMKAIVVKQIPTYEEGATAKVGSLIDIWLIATDTLGSEINSEEVIEMNF